MSRRYQHLRPHPLPPISDAETWQCMSEAWHMLQDAQEARGDKRRLREIRRARRIREGAIA